MFYVVAYVYKTKKIIFFMESNLYGFIPIFMQIAFSAVFVFVTIYISKFLGPRVITGRKRKNFECGLEPTGYAHAPFPVRYFIIALLFVLFDLEVVFMYPWAVNFQEFDWTALVKMGVFILLLAVGYFYVLKKKALDWEK